jgi:hypothetical protein
MRGTTEAILDDAPDRVNEQNRRGQSRVRKSHGRSEPVRPDGLDSPASRA